MIMIDCLSLLQQYKWRKRIAKRNYKLLMILMRYLFKSCNYYKNASMYIYVICYFHSLHRH